MDKSIHRIFIYSRRRRTSLAYAVRHECWRFCEFVFEFYGNASTRHLLILTVLEPQTTAKQKKGMLVWGCVWLWVGVSSNCTVGLLWEFFPQSLAQPRHSYNTPRIVPQCNRTRHRSSGARILKRDNRHHNESHSWNCTVELFWGKTLPSFLACETS